MDIETPTAPAPQPPTVPQPDTYTELRTALNSERARAAALEAELAQTRSQYQSSAAQIEQLTQTLNGVRIDSTATNLLADVLPQYRGLLLPLVRQNLQVSADGQVMPQANQTTDAILSGLRTQYPALFASVESVPVGGGMVAAAAAAAPASQSVSAENGVITGVSADALAAGQVRISGI